MTYWRKGLIDKWVEQWVRNRSRRGRMRHQRMITGKHGREGRDDLSNCFTMPQEGR